MSDSAQQASVKVKKVKTEKKEKKDKKEKKVKSDKTEKKVKKEKKVKSESIENKENKENKESVDNKENKENKESTVSSELIIADEKALSFTTEIQKHIDLYNTTDLFKTAKLPTRVIRGRSIQEAKHPDEKLRTPLMLDENFRKVSYIKGLNTNLQEHQQTLVAAMIELENTRRLKCSMETIEFNSALLSERVGAGKTIIMLVVILANKVPMYPILLSGQNYQSFRNIKISRDYENTNVHYYPVITFKPKTTLKCNLIFVGKSVIHQWVRAIKQFTNLTYFAVYSVIELRTLIRMITQQTVNKYDIIIVSHVQITVDLNMPDHIEFENINICKNPYMLNIIGNLRDVVWNRVIYDDFDNMKHALMYTEIHGLFHWYISATKRVDAKMDSDMNYVNSYKESYSIDKPYNRPSWPVLNPYLQSWLNLRCTDEYSKRSTNMLDPKIYLCQLFNPNFNYLSALNGVNDNDIVNVSEMLNSDAIQTAASNVGIKTDNVSDIFAKLLGDKFDRYRDIREMLKFLQTARFCEKKDMPNKRDGDENKAPAFNEQNLRRQQLPRYKYPDLDKMINTVEAEYKIEMTKMNQIVQRIRRNVTEDKDCPICLTELNQCRSTMIMTCCGIVMCMACGLDAQKLIRKLNDNNVDKKNMFQQGVCSQCRANITIKNVIYLSDSCDINDILNEDQDINRKIKHEEKVREEKKPIHDDEDMPDDGSSSKRSKIQVVLDIVRGKKPREAKRSSTYIPNMVRGTNYMLPKDYEKVIIFANYDETFSKLVDVFKEHNIKFWQLHGTGKMIDDTSNEFIQYQSNSALLVNGIKYCSGLNLQSATSLIFIHSMADMNITAQAVGRVQRIGRKSNINIYFILYDNEVRDMEMKGSPISVMNDVELYVELKKEMEILESHGNYSDNGLDATLFKQFKADYKALKNKIREGAIQKAENEDIKEAIENENKSPEQLQREQANTRHKPKPKRKGKKNADEDGDMDEDEDEVYHDEDGDFKRDRIGDGDGDNNDEDNNEDNDEDNSQYLPPVPHKANNQSTSQSRSQNDNLSFLTEEERRWISQESQ